MSDPDRLVEIAPSILAADPLDLGGAVRAVQEAGVTRVQVDVMDGRFVPNITYGPDVVAAVAAASTLTVEAHLMIVEPERYVERFAAAGADVIIVHQEVSPQLYRTLEVIRTLGKKAGVALNPGTPLDVIREVFQLTDLLLIMTVNPGFGGQTFLIDMLPKIRAARTWLDRCGSTADLEVDGGIDETTALDVVAAGARVLVAGTSVYGSKRGVGQAVADLRSAALRGLAE